MDIVNSLSSGFSHLCYSAQESVIRNKVVKVLSTVNYGAFPALERDLKNIPSTHPVDLNKLFFPENIWGQPVFSTFLTNWKNSHSLNRYDDRATISNYVDFVYVGLEHFHALDHSKVIDSLVEGFHKVLFSPISDCYGSTMLHSHLLNFLPLPDKERFVDQLTNIPSIVRQQFIDNLLDNEVTAFVSYLSLVHEFIFLVLPQPSQTQLDNLRGLLTDICNAVKGADSGTYAAIAGEIRSQVQNRPNLAQFIGHVLFASPGG